MSARISKAMTGAAAAALVAACGTLASAEVVWRSTPAAAPVAGFADQMAMAPDAIAATAVDVEAAGERHLVVTIASPVTAFERAEFEAAGLTLLNYLGRTPTGGVAYFAAMSIDGLNANAATAAGLTSAQRVEPTVKLHPTLAAGDMVDWAVVPNDDAGQDERPDAEPITADRTIALNVLFHGDVNAQVEGRETIEAVGGVVRTQLRSVNGAVIHIAESKIAELAKQPAMMWIEPPLPEFSNLNDEARAITEAEIVQAAPYGLDGSGVTVMIYDGGTVSGHPDMSTRLTLGDSDGTSDHATHVAGTVGGDGGQSGGQHRGMAPAVDFVSYGFEVSGGLQPGFLYTDPGDLEADYTDAFITRGADIANNSIGSNVEPNGYSCSWQGDYGVTASVLDGVVRGSLGEPIKTVWAAGNERTGSRCNVEGFGDFYSMSPPQGAKNQISVGAINANDDSMTSFSSWGPVDDGRLRPDVVGPGCSTAGDDGITSCSSFSSGYSTKCGTSMASPAVAGVGALLIQEHRNLFPGEGDFRNSTLKAILTHTAWDLGNPGPDFAYGYGSVRAQAAVDFMRTTHYTEEQVVSGGSYGAVAVVAPGDDKLKITIAWDDAPGTPNVVGSLVNDLDLVVTSPSGTRFYPWTLDPNDPNAPAVQNQPDSLNNLEQVEVDNPEPGVWLIDVVGTNVPDGPQPFSLAVTPFLRNCTDAGVVQFQGGLFNCSDTATLVVNDCGLNTDDGTIDSAEVVVSSDSDPVGLTLFLDEEAAGAARFTGDVSFSTDGAAGTLLVSPGDTVYIEYFDTDDGSGGSGLRTSTATIDCTSPTVSDVAVADLQPRSATVTFTTDEPASATISYGTDCGTLTNTVSSNSRVTSHSLSITGLLDDVTYQYVITVTDEAGNERTVSPRGSCYSFTTPEVPDFYTAELNDPSPIEFRTVTYTPGSSNPAEFYTACEEDALMLPVPPGGAVLSSLGDDNFETISLTTPVSLYGVQYSTIYVGSNGYITFLEGDTDRSDSFSDHFEQPRISGVFDDLDVGDGGTVYFEEFADKAVVTFDRVSEWNQTDNENTFQVEMFFDGEIRVTYGSIDSTDFITGLSAGNGEDPDFFESPFGNYGACGPRPPRPTNAEVSTIAFDAVEITLEANDDGLPNGELSYSITQLPQEGFLVDADDPAQPLITTTPYELAGDTVRYAAPSTYVGLDTIEFKADDGGVAPDGGVSPDAGGVTVDVLPTDLIALYSFLTDDQNPGWSTEGAWAFGSPNGNDGDPGAAFTGTNVYGYNLNGAYGNNMPVRALTAGPIDLSEMQGGAIKFRRWLGVEASAFDNAAFQISFNGSNWQNLWVHSGSTFQESAWSEQEYDISAIADGAPAVWFRWTMGTTDFSVTYSGWNIDDVQIMTTTPPPCDGDANADGVVNADDLLSVLGSFGAAAAGRSGGDLNDDGVVNADDLLQVLGAFGATCQ